MPKKPRRRRPLAECPNCGEPFPDGRPACPSCGSDAETGWQSGDEVEVRSLDVPDAFDDEDYRRTVEDIQDAAGATRHGTPRRPWTSRQVRIFVIGVLLVAAMIVPALLALLRMQR